MKASNERTPGFPVTRWSLVERAVGVEDVAIRTAALEELCRLYWYPLYAFARQRGILPEDAEDRTQDFFVEILHSPFLDGADPSRGKLRTFLLTAFQRHLIDGRRHQQAIKRGGGSERVPLELLGAEQIYQAEACSAVTAEENYDREWALTLLRQSLATLVEQYAVDGKRELFEHLRPFLDTVEIGAVQYDELCSRTGLSRVAARQSVHRMRVRFRRIVRALIADTLRDGSDEAVNEELSVLYALLSR